jgi:hypothetical protein
MGDIMKFIRIVFYLSCAAMGLFFSNCNCDSNELGLNTGEYIPPPDTPHSPYPVDDSSGQSRTPAFSWECDDSNEDFDIIYEYTLRRFDNAEPPVEFSTDDKFLRLPDTLDAETRYVWSVLAVGSHGKSSQSSAWQFETGTGYNNPPYAPYLTYPINGSSLIPLDVVLAWTCTDPDGDELTYDIWLGLQGGTLELVREGHDGMEYQSDSLDYTTWYDWQVVANDAESESAPSDIRTFWTRGENVAPDQVQIVYPPDNAVEIPLDVVLQWSCSDPDGDALVYDVTFGGNKIAENIPDTFLSVQGLDYGTEYSWYLVVTDNKGNYSSSDLATFTTIVDPGDYHGVYAEMVVHRYLSWGGESLTRIDHLSARFDSVYAPDGPIVPLRPEAVSANTGGPLEWVEGQSWYYFHNPTYGWFLGPGIEVVFTVTGGDGVPSLVTDPIIFPACGPYITSPAIGEYVTLEGLEVVWSHYDTYPDCDRPVTIRIQDMGFVEWTDVCITTENDGSYTFTADDVAVLDPYVYQIQIVLIVDNKEYISAPGYDPRSWVWARTYATQLVFINP